MKPLHAKRQTTYDKAMINADAIQSLIESLHKVFSPTSSKSTKAELDGDENTEKGASNSKEKKITIVSIGAPTKGDHKIPKLKGE